jgi:hypothetical protein
MREGRGEKAKNRRRAAVLFGVGRRCAVQGCKRTNEHRTRAKRQAVSRSRPVAPPAFALG